MKSRKKTFYAYVVPSVGSMLVTSLYVVVDGIFVGQGISKNALASINIACPIIMLIIAIAMMITVGGATMCAIAMGRKDYKEANQHFVLSIKLLLAFSIGITLFTMIFARPIVRLLGANRVLEGDSVLYLRYFVLFCVFFTSSMALSAFVRNDGDPRLAFWGMLLGGVMNIFLDWLFIYPFNMGIVGPAIASGLGQGFSCLLMLSHFVRKKGILKWEHVRFEKKIAREIFMRGTPEFMNQLFQPMTVLCYNLIAMRAFGEVGVAAFSVVYYILTITVSVFIGLTQGIQPLIGRSHGQNNLDDERYYYRKGIAVNVFLAFLVYSSMLIFGKSVIALFNSDPSLITIAYGCISVYGLSFLLTAVNTVVLTYYTAIKRTKDALVISFVRCMVFIPVCIFVTARLFDSTMLWGGIIFAEICSLMHIGLVSYKERAGFRTLLFENKNTIYKKRKR